MRRMRKLKVLCVTAIAALSMAMTGCSGSSAATEKMPLAYLRTEIPEIDTEGAEIELLNLEDPLEFCYSMKNADMLFSMEDGVWLDYIKPEVAIDQEYFWTMAENFLYLKAVEKVEGATMDECGLTSPQYSVFITDEAKGNIAIYIGNQADDGNYYVTVDERNIYTMKDSVVESLNFDYETLVVRDSLNITVTADQIKKATVTSAGKTTTIKTSDKETMEKIANGLTNLKPTVYSDFLADASELASVDLSEEKRITFYGEIKNGDAVQSLTIYAGCYADIDENYRYVQLDGSKMISLVPSEIIDSILNIR